MIVHHLNCISTCPVGGHLMDGRTPGLFTRATLACHCLLLETADRLVLVDTGLGLRDVAAPRDRLSGFFLGLLSPDLRREMTAAHQVRALGYAPEDVTDIVLTHLDFDHAGGLDDFPAATVHLRAVEQQFADRQHTWLDRQRFRPAQWGSRLRWRTYDDARTETWMGFDSVSGLHGLPPEILMVHLPGHTHGHAGVAIRRDQEWLLLAGDAYFDRREMDPEPRCTPGLRLYQCLMEKDRRARLEHRDRLRHLALRESGVTIFCSHDPVQFEALAGRALGEPCRPRASG